MVQPERSPITARANQSLRSSCSFSSMLPQQLATTRMTVTGPRISRPSCMAYRNTAFKAILGLTSVQRISPVAPSHCCATPRTSCSQATRARRSSSACGVGVCVISRSAAWPSTANGSTPSCKSVTMVRSVLCHLGRRDIHAVALVTASLHVQDLWPAEGPQ